MFKSGHSNLAGVFVRFPHVCPGPPCAIAKWLRNKAKVTNFSARPLMNTGESVVESRSQFEAEPSGADNTKTVPNPSTRRNRMVQAAPHFTALDPGAL